MRPRFSIRRRLLFTSLIPQAILLFLSGAAARGAGPATRPYLLHLPGVGGYSAIDRSLLAGLDDGGLDADRHVYDWTGKDKGVPALQSYEHNHKEAARIADLITAQYHAHPATR